MEPDSVPDGDETLNRITPLPIVIRQAFEAGTQEAREYFGQRREPIEPYLFANIARYRAVCYLRGHSQALVEYAQEELNNNGVGLIFSGCYLRVWKARHGVGESKGHVPAAGHSHVRQAFLSQHIQLPLFAEEDSLDDALRTVDLNLVMLWDVDKKHRLSELRLVMPKNGNVHRTSTYWDIPIPNPILAMGAQEDSFYSAEMEDELADEINLPEEDTGKTGTGQAE